MEFIDNYWLIIPAIVSLVWMGWFFKLFHVMYSKHRLPFDGSTVLLVIAHPDDESMFFGPTLINLKKRGTNIIILCLSRGNYYGDGEKRRQEMMAATDHFGITDVTIIDDDKLKDGMDEKWDEQLIQSYVLEQIRRNRDITSIITFDRNGVSGHPNHKSVSESLRKFSKTFNFDVYQLETVALLRKYSWLMDLILVSIEAMGLNNLFIEVVSISDVSKIRGGLQKHQSQMIWFRKLYMLFSRYMVINTFAKIIRPLDD